ncbi:hypothetical protein [Bradyrhizobium erythrophlei]|nr:hypothetical protein [Bradyrhizobium erythrophlei]
MLDKITKIVSIGTVVGLYLTALFNIGYFYVVGYHFIGLVDISNVAYTFGLVVFFLLVFLLLTGFVSILAEQLYKVILLLSEKVRKILAAILAVIMLTGVPLGLYFWVLAVPGHFASGLIIPLAGIAAGAIAYVQWKKGTVPDWKLVGVSIVFISFGTIVVGGLISKFQIASVEVHYDIITKTGSFSDVRLVRSSSAGIIFSQLGRVMFVPMGEVRFLSATGSEMR